MVNKSKERDWSCNKCGLEGEYIMLNGFCTACYFEKLGEDVTELRIRDKIQLNNEKIYATRRQKK